MNNGILARGIFERLMLVYSMIMLFPAQIMLDLTSIYTLQSPRILTYHYRDLQFSVLLLPIIVFAIMRLRKTKAVLFPIVICLVALKDFALLSDPNYRHMLSFDIYMYLVMLAGWAIPCVMMSTHVIDNRESFNNLLDIYYLISFCTTILRMILGMSTDGRFGAIGLGVGGFGYLSALYLISLFSVRQDSNKCVLLKICAAIGLLVSGQRTALGVFFAIILVKSLVDFLVHKKKKFSALGIAVSALMLSVALLVLLMLMISNSGTVTSGSDGFVGRIINAISELFSGNLVAIESVSGRFDSIEAGFAIMKEKPNGLLNVFYELQYEMNVHGYPTFPHSTLLSCMLMWSPIIAIAIFVWLVVLSIKLARLRNSYFWVILAIVLLAVIWGGPIIDYPLLSVMILFISMAKNGTNDAEDKARLTSVNENSSEAAKLQTCKA